MVDLGAWPGSWSQLLAERVGEKGRVVAVDVEPLEELGPPVRVLQADLLEPGMDERIAEELGVPAAAVLCDAAPKLSGIADRDRALLEELWWAALGVARRVLAPRGFLVIKGFPGAEAQAFRRELQQHFERVAEVRPEGKRGSSREFYWLAGPKPPARRKRGARRRTL